MNWDAQQRQAFANNLRILQEEDARTFAYLNSRPVQPQGCGYERRIKQAFADVVGTRRERNKAMFAEWDRSRKAAANANAEWEARYFASMVNG